MTTIPIEPRASDKRGRTVGCIASGSTKADAYRGLVADRKACRRCPALANPSTVAGGAFDSEEVGPYTRWHGDLDARLVVVGKDFAPVGRFEEFEGRPGSGVETNRRLGRYLELAGFVAGPTSNTHRSHGMFFTNAVLCLPGGDSMRTEVQVGELNACAERFLGATLRLVAPRAVATLGLQATNAVLRACDLPRTRRFSDLVAAPDGSALSDGMVLFAMPHPVASRTRPEQEAAWRRIRRFFDRE